MGPQGRSVSPSEIAFLGVGLVIGAAIGAAVVEALRARPAPRRHVRLTISPNSITPRRSATLADPIGANAPIRVPGSPEDAAWPEPGPAAAALGPAAGPEQAPGRTRVPSGPVQVPASAIAVPVDRPAPPVPSKGGAAPGNGGSPGAPTGTTAILGGGTSTRAGYPTGLPSATAVGGLTSIAVLDPVAPLTSEDLTRIAIIEATVVPAADGGSTATLAVGSDVPGLPARARPPVVEDRPGLAAGAVAITAIEARGGSGDPPGSAGDPAAVAAPDVAADPCAGQRTLVDERCALAGAARDHAKAAADALRDAQRAYDALRERLDRAQADADPRQIAAAKDELHRQFRRASEAASGAEATEAAAREWLTAINDLNARTRDAKRFLDAGNADLRAAMPRLDRLAVEADSARISAEGAELGCQEARERLAACEEQADAVARQAAAPPPEVEPHPFDALWPAENEATFGSSHAEGPPMAAASGNPVILRILRGDRAARDQLVASIAAGDADASREWQLRITALVDAIVARAIEAGYLDLPASDPFWGLFEHRERREIIGALSALGFRFDGLGGFADERVPAARDLSLAVGYAGLDRMRIRTWPREGELATLYEHATVAADEWLVEEADDLALGRMVDALGARAAELADVWNAWGRLRPALLSEG